MNTTRLTPFHPAIWLLSFSLFAMGSAEFLMGGILPMIATSLHITLPQAGTLIAAFSTGALIGAPPFAILAMRWSKRQALFVSQVIFIAATAFSILIPGYGAVLVARFVMGVAYACFWAVAAAMAVALAPSGRRGKALSIVVSGLTVAMVLGGPAGTVISGYAGWHAGFWAVVVVTSLAAVIGIACLPQSMSDDSSTLDLRTELRAMGRSSLWVAWAMTAITTAAYMGTFGYLAAVLLDVTGVSAYVLPLVLTLFGVGAFVGLTVGGRTADHHLWGTLVAGTVGMLVISVAIALLPSCLWMMVILVFLLGLCGFLVNPAVWAHVYAVAPDAPMLAGATNSSAFQAGLTLAPLLAGLPMSAGYGVMSVGWVGAALSLVALGMVVINQQLKRL